MVVYPTMLSKRRKYTVVNDGPLLNNVWANDGRLLNNVGANNRRLPLQCIVD